MQTKARTFLFLFTSIFSLYIFIKHRFITKNLVITSFFIHMKKNKGVLNFKSWHNE